jgi:hypothetical protein
METIVRLLCSFLLTTGLAVAQFPESPTASDFFHDKTQMNAAAFAMTLRAADLGQTIYHMDQSTLYAGKEYHGRETWLPTQNKGLISIAVMGSGALSTYGQFRLFRTGHKRTAVALQLVSAAISGVAIYRSFHSTYTVAPARGPH